VKKKFVANKIVQDFDAFVKWCLNVPRLLHVAHARSFKTSIWSF
jgi:hypothetical protein